MRKTIQIDPFEFRGKPEKLPFNLPPGALRMGMVGAKQKFRTVSFYFFFLDAIISSKALFISALALVLASLSFSF